MNIFQRIGVIFLVIIGIALGISTFMYAFSIYPSNCSILFYPLYENCVKESSMNTFNFTINNNGKKDYNYIVKFYVNVPEYTPQEDIIFLETNIGNYQMQKIGENLWYVNFSYRCEVKYRYNRNNLGFFSAEQFEPDNDKTFRTLTFEKKPKEVRDNVNQWRYLSGRKLQTIESSAPFTEFYKREFEKGFAMVEYFMSGFIYLTGTTCRKIKEHNGEWVMVSMQNPYIENSTIPLISSSETTEKIREEVFNFKKEGLSVVLKTRLCCNNPVNTKHDDEWWNMWFAEAKKTILKDARIASETGADKLLIDYTYGYSIPDEIYAPQFAKEKWDDIISSVKEVYTGKIGFNSFIDNSYKEMLFFWPNGIRRFSLDVDFYNVELWTGIADTPDVSQDTLNNNAENIMGKVSRAVYGLRKPVTLTLAYPSVHKAELGEKGVNSATPGLVPYEVMSPELIFDAPEQAMIYEAFMKAIAPVASINGVYAYGYHFVDLPDSVDHSIRGKEAENIISGWYQNFD